MGPSSRTIGLVSRTDFITRYLRSKWLDRSARWLAALCFMLSLLPQVHAQALAQVVKVQRVDGAILLTAQVQFELPLAVEAALQKGIPLFFVAQADIVRQRWYWMDKNIISAQRYFRIAYQPLVRRWRLTLSSGTSKTGSLGLALNQYFDSLPQALDVVKKISHWQLADVSELSPDNEYVVEFHFKLDLTQLPLPLQIGTLGHSDWDVFVAQSVPLSLEPAK